MQNNKLIATFFICVLITSITGCVNDSANGESHWVKKRESSLGSLTLVPNGPPTEIEIGETAEIISKFEIHWRNTGNPPTTINPVEEALDQLKLIPCSPNGECPAPLSCDTPFMLCIDTQS